MLLRKALREKNIHLQLCSAFIKKSLRISGSTRFKPVLCKGQLCKDSYTLTSHLGDLPEDIKLKCFSVYCAFEVHVEICAQLWAFDNTP